MTNLLLKFLSLIMSGDSVASGTLNMLVLRNEAIAYKVEELTHQKRMMAAKYDKQDAIRDYNSQRKQIEEALSLTLD